MCQPAQSDDDVLLTPAQVARVLSVSENWLAVARHRGKHLSWVVVGPKTIRYRAGVVRKFLEDRAHGRIEPEHLDATP